MAAFRLTFRLPPTAHVAWALADDETRLVLGLCQDIARDKTLTWLGDAVVARPGQGRADSCVFRHYESRAGKPLLHHHAIVSIRARRPHDGKRGKVSADSLMIHIVAADTLYTLCFMEEVSAQLGWA